MKLKTVSFLVLVVLFSLLVVDFSASKRRHVGKRSKERKTKTKIVRPPKVNKSFQSSKKYHIETTSDLESTSASVPRLHGNFSLVNSFDKLNNSVVYKNKLTKKTNESKLIESYKIQKNISSKASIFAGHGGKNTIKPSTNDITITQNDESLKDDSKLDKITKVTARPCSLKAIKHTIINLVFKEALSANTVILIWISNVTLNEKINRLNESLMNNNLDPFPSCTMKSEEIAKQEQTSSIAATTVLFRARENRKKSNAEDYCNPELILSKLEAYSSFDELPFEKIVKIFSGKYSQTINVTAVNEMVTQANVGIPSFPVLSCVDGNAILEENNCTKVLANTSLQERIEILNQLEKEGLVPEKSLEKLVNGNISYSSFKSMVINALSKSEKLPDYCKNESLSKISFEIQEIESKRNISLSEYPRAIRMLIESGKMPNNIKEAIFSGAYNRTEIIRMISGNDDVIKELLPQKLKLLIKDNPIPIELKLLIFSGKNRSEIRRTVESNEELLQKLMPPSTLFFYQLFSIPRNKDINTAINIVVIISLTCVMTSLGCTLTINEIKNHAKKPKGVIIALISQFLMLPAAAFGLIQIFGLELYAAMAVLICGCCPGGNLSNIIAYAINGDMNLSILMTTCSSVLGLGLMPLNIFLYSKLIIPLDSGEVVPFGKIVLNIVLTIIPVGIGISIRRYKPQWVLWVMRGGGIILLLSMITVAVLSGVMFGDSFFVYFPPPVLACCAILPLAGYVFGYLFAWVARENTKCMRTISVETGCQNVQLCSTVLKLAFEPIVMGVLFLLPIVYMCFQILEAIILICLYRLVKFLKNRNNKNGNDKNKRKRRSLTESEEKINSDLDPNEKKRFDTLEEKKEPKKNLTTLKNMKRSEIVEYQQQSYREEQKAKNSENSELLLPNGINNQDVENLRDLEVETLV